MRAHFNVVITHEPPWFVAACLENNVASQGKSVEEALENLKEALELYYEDGDQPLREPVKVFLTSLEVSVP